MATDLGLAALHHLLVFGLAAMLVAEAVLLRGPLTADAIPRLAKLDGGYGLCAGLLLVVGLLRVFHGVKGEDFYLHNPWFHAKVGAFVLVGLLSILPTVRFLRWRKAHRANPGFVPATAELARLRTVLRLELALVAAIFVLAAAMARYGGF
jgi:putative membrane protein